MSDRTCVLDEDGLQLFMDGDSGTWRLFVTPDSDCIDLSLSQLRTLSVNLAQILADIEQNPNDFNAEVRKTWDA